MRKMSPTDRGAVLYLVGVLCIAVALVYVPTRNLWLQIIGICLCFPGLYVLWASRDTIRGRYIGREVVISIISLLGGVVMMSLGFIHEDWPTLIGGVTMAVGSFIFMFRAIEADIASRTEAAIDNPVARTEHLRGVLSLGGGFLIAVIGITPLFPTLFNACTGTGIAMMGYGIYFVYADYIRPVLEMTTYKAGPVEYALGYTIALTEAAYAVLGQEGDTLTGELVIKLADGFATMAHAVAGVQVNGLTDRYAAGYAAGNEERIERVMAGEGQPLHTVAMMILGTIKTRVLINIMQP